MVEILYTLNKKIIKVLEKTLLNQK